MKFARIGAKGAERPVVLDHDGEYRDLSGVIYDIAGPALADLDRLRTSDLSSLPIMSREERIGPCVGGVGKFLCIGLNYADHAAESGMLLPEEPIVFSKATSSIIGPNDDVWIPRNSQKSDWEVELGIVIGRDLVYAADEAEAATAIAGYCVVNDLSEREWQLERGGTWDKGKGCDTFGPIGPWLVTPDEVPDPANLAMWLEVDGHRYQDGSTQTMIFKPAFLIHYLSQFMSLQPGDIISTGTPPGVGMGQKPPVYLRAGQTIQLGIAGLGEQRQCTVASNSVT